MKKYLLSLIPLFLLLLFGCSAGNTTEINDRLIIEAIGIDITGKDDFRITVQALDSISSGSGDTSANGDNITRSYCFYGDTVADAISEISAKTGLIPLFSQMRIILLGEKVVREKLNEALDYFIRENTARNDVLIAAASGEAKDITDADLGSNIIGGKIVEDILYSDISGNISYAVPLYKFISRLLSDTDCAYCPLMSTIADEVNKEFRMPAVSGLLIFGNDGNIIFVGKEQSKTVLLLNGVSDKALFTVKTDDGIFSLRTADIKTKIKITADENDMPFIQITRSIKCDLTEYESKKNMSISEKMIQKAARQCADDITQADAEMLRLLYYESGYDICRTNALFRLKFPKLYKLSAHKKNLPVQTTVTVNVTIRRTGREIIKN